MQSLIKNVWARLVAYFLTGVFAILPLVITVAVVAWVVGILDQFLGPESLVGKLLVGMGGYLFGWVIVLAAIFGLGFVLIELGIRRLLGRIIDAVVARIPLVGQIYGTSKQLVDMLDKEDDDKLQGMAPVFCYFGTERNAGVLALLVSAERFRINDREYQIIMIPTAPVPFGGGMLFMPVELIEPANMSVDGLMSIYVSMGVTAPQFMQPVAEGPQPGG